MPEDNPRMFVGRGTDRARVVEMDETMQARVEEQRQAFIARFGRPPGPGDPMVWDPDCDEPTPLSEERFVELMGGPEKAAAFDAAFDRAADDRNAVLEEHGMVMKVGRNDPCPCGSGLKYKRCCG